MVFLWIMMLLAAPSGRVLESVVPGAETEPACSTAIELVNVGSRAASIEWEAHRAGGALVALPGGGSMVLAPGERRSFSLEPEVWVKVREQIAPAEHGPAVSAQGRTECTEDNRLRTVRRDAVFPMRNPWFAGDVSPPGGMILFINAGERPAYASGCYSSGNVYSLPGRGPNPPSFEPVCSETFDVQVPPFASREFPAERNGSRWFGLKTRGTSIVLQMLRPADSGTKLFVVDSTIRFGGEVTSR